MKKYLFLLVFLVQPVSSQAASGEAQIARFEKWLSVLRAPIESSEDPKEVIEALQLEPFSRIASFQLQVLAQLYQSQDSEFDSIRSDFKMIEDYLGSLDYLGKKLDRKEADIQQAIDEMESSKKIQKLKDQKKEIKEEIKDVEKDFAKDLENEKFVRPSGKKNRIEKITKFLKEFSWMSYSDDKMEMLNGLIDQLDSVRSQSYDMTRLEKRKGKLLPTDDGNGLHELRREVRRFNQQSVSLNGMVTYRSGSACPDSALDQFEKKVFQIVPKNDHNNIKKYASLPDSSLEISPCEISKCLNYAVVYAVYQLGEIKDDVEKLNRDLKGLDADTVPVSHSKAAQDVYDWLKKHDVLGALMDELKSCQRE